MVEQYWFMYYLWIVLTQKMQNMYSQIQTYFLIILKQMRSQGHCFYQNMCYLSFLNYFSNNYPFTIFYQNYLKQGLRSIFEELQSLYENKSEKIEIYQKDKKNVDGKLKEEDVKDSCLGCEKYRGVLEMSDKLRVIKIVEKKDDLQQYQQMQVRSDKKGAFYGFYCSLTNQFYYVQSQEILEQLLAVMKEQNLRLKQRRDEQQKMRVDEDLNDLYVRLMDEEVMSIFKDPIFAIRQQVELKQYDF